MSITLSDQIDIASATHRPHLSTEGLEPTDLVSMLDQSGQRSWVPAAVEHALTITIDGEELVTLMTIGSNPEYLVLGYLRNQCLFDNLDQIASISVCWEREMAAVVTRCGKGLDPRSPRSRTPLEPLCIGREEIGQVISQVPEHNHVYRRSGSVHGCGLYHDGRMQCFVEDVGRHNATDALSGWMWLHGISGTGGILYCTGRLTAEIVDKAALMGLSVVISRNGVTSRAVELAEESRLMLIARARRKTFQIFSCLDRLVMDVPRTIQP